MESLVPTLLFIIPGLMGYYWIGLFGKTPPQKHSDFEIATLSVLLWVPIMLINIGLIDGGIYLLSRMELMDANYILYLEDFISKGTYLPFYAVYMVTSAVSSFVFGLLYCAFLHKVFIFKPTNWVRKKLGLAKRTDSSSVWEDFTAKADAKIFEVGSINSDQTIIGSLKFSSKPEDEERCVALIYTEEYTDLVKKGDVRTEMVYIDTKSGTIIKRLSNDDVLQNYESYQKD